MAGTDIHSWSAWKLLCKPQFLVQKTERTHKSLGKKVMAIYTLLVSDKVKQMSMSTVKAVPVVSFCLERKKVLLLWYYLLQLKWQP